MAFRIILQCCIFGYAVAIVTELIMRRKWGRFALEAAALSVMVGIALLINNSVTGRMAFGEGASPIRTIGIMFIGIVCGIAARYVFYLNNGQFSWLDFFKPIAISPIVLLPLIGSVQTTGELSSIQVISFGVLAFQNGFFWQAVLEGAKPRTQTSQAV